MLRIRTRTIGRMTSSSGAMKFSTPVAPSQMVGTSAPSSLEAASPALFPASSFFVSGSTMVVSKSMLFLPLRRGAADGALAFIDVRPWKMVIWPFLLHRPQTTFLFSGQLFAPCSVEAQWKQILSFIASSTLSCNDIAMTRLHCEKGWEL